MESVNGRMLLALDSTDSWPTRPRWTRDGNRRIPTRRKEILPAPDSNHPHLLRPPVLQITWTLHRPASSRSEAQSWGWNLKAPTDPADTPQAQAPASVLHPKVLAPITTTMSRTGCPRPEARVVELPLRQVSMEDECLLLDPGLEHRAGQRAPCQAKIFRSTIPRSDTLPRREVMAATAQWIYNSGDRVIPTRSALPLRHRPPRAGRCLLPRCRVPALPANPPLVPGPEVLPATTLTTTRPRQATTVGTVNRIRQCDEMSWSYLQSEQLSVPEENLQENSYDLTYCHQI